MTRRLTIATMFLVLVLLCLLLVGMTGAMRASGAPGPAMSGDFADTHLACLGGGRAPSIYVPSERWFRGHPAGGRHASGRLRPSTSLWA